MRPKHLKGRTTHARRGALTHSFAYAVDYVLVDPDADTGPFLFSRNRFNLASVCDRDHGGRPGRGCGSDWARRVLDAHGLDQTGDSRLLLLTQPRFAGFVFNPVSFWLRFEQDVLVAVIAEVNNTFGDRHSYLCHLPGFAPIHATDTIKARKIFHVSPFQDIAGSYEFNFNISPDKIAIRIGHINGTEGLVATLSGRLVSLSNTSLLGAALLRPFGPLRTVALIYWNALRLKLKGAFYRSRPAPPAEEITRALCDDSENGQAHV
ncbi:cyclopropane-fatty-acyl-phospholipid synthase [Ruegeria marisrubri]|uniref:Cyclopropane-fatty-acyl-phospholipid synthase n=2 Tax=Ruegeria marisrubri TaxID=1685379 RepID=A0A0X3UEY0_9RHOB|nr:DUF1365 domain-containing protein [Ruegeria marisrubri]KUJ85486.1 cyclopropane-fatty-acyl-phospholipid synthase [Ruegeria marisrubri]